MKSLTAIGLASAFLLGACAAPPVVAPGANVPAILKPADNEKAQFIWAARGVQIYECKANPSANGAWLWTFVAPKAQLYDAKGVPVGEHGAGPYWAASDGSRVNGTVKQRADSPASGSIPWLLLTATSSGGPGKMSKITSVQRINTAGGAAPVQGCAGQPDAGKLVQVPYTSDYVFFAMN
jgi:Protein of unknown function (DUF3455)